METIKTKQINRDRVVTIKFTREEKDAIKDYFGKRGLSLTAGLRSIAISLVNKVD